MESTYRQATPSSTHEASNLHERERKSSRAALRFYKWKPDEVLVIYDDVSLTLGSLRFRMHGSAGGHNGMKSLIQHFGADTFPRLKIGIGATETWRDGRTRPREIRS